MKSTKVSPAPLVSPTSPTNEVKSSSPSSTVQSNLNRVETYTVGSPLAASSLFTYSSNVSLIFKYLQRVEQHLELTYPSYFKPSNWVSASSFSYEDKNALQNWVLQSKAKLKKSTCCSSSYPDEIIDFYSYLNTLKLEKVTHEVVKEALIKILPSLEEKAVSPSPCCKC